MTLKTNVTTKNAGALSDGPTQWSEARLAYPLYAALATQFNLAPLPHAAGEPLPERPTRDVFDADLKWLDGIDQNLRAFQIRQLPPDVLNASEEALRAFLQRQLESRTRRRRSATRLTCCWCSISRCARRKNSIEKTSASRMWRTFCVRC